MRQLRDGYRAKCPAHNGHSKDSLWISERDDGSVGLHCFGGCSALEVLHALGLELRDLYPRAVGNRAPSGRQERRIWGRLSRWSAALGTIHEAAKVVQIAEWQGQG